MPAPSLRIPLSLNMTEFNKNVESAKSATSTVSRVIVKNFVEANTALLATGSAARSAATGFTTVLGALGPLSLALTGIVATFKLMAYASGLAKEQIEEFNEVAEKAGKASVSTDFFQRMAKSAESLKVPVDEVTSALEKFNRVATDKLGGSELNQRVTQLTEFGNFKGNTGVGQLAGATGTEEKLKATVSLIDQALQSGQRLAGLDIAEKAFGPELTQRLRENAGFLDQMLEAAQKISAEKIISDEQVAKAIELKSRLEDAQKVLADKFKPIQDDLAKLGTQYHQNWIEIVELIARAVENATSLYSALKGIPGLLAQAGSASFWTQLTEFTGRLGLNSKDDLVKPGEPGFLSAPGTDALRSALGNPFTVRRKMQEATDIQSLVRGDTSKGPPPKEAAAAEKDSFDKAIDSINKHIATLKADNAAVFENTAVQGQFRTEFQLLNSIMKDNGEVTQEQLDRYEELRPKMSAINALQEAGITLTEKHAEAFTKASVSMRQVGDASIQAHTALQRVNSASQQIGSALSTAFADAIVEGKSLNDVFNSLIKTLEKAAINSLFTSLFSPGVGGGVSPIASLFRGGFAEGTDYAPGGWSWVGEKGPELVNLPRGSQVLPASISSSVGSAGSPIIFSPHIDARGADVAAVAKIAQILTQQQKSFASDVVSVIKKARQGRNI